MPRQKRSPFPENLKLLRFRHGRMTQDELEIKSGIKLHRIYRLERGLRTPTADELKAIARVFKVSVESLTTSEASAELARA